MYEVNCPNPDNNSNCRKVIRCKDTSRRNYVIKNKIICVSCANSGKRNGMFGKTQTQESKNKIGVANKGKLIGDKNPSKRPEVRKQISEYMSTNNPMKYMNVYERWVEKYGVEQADRRKELRRERRSLARKKWWKNLTEDELKEYKKTHGSVALKLLLKNGGKYSKLHLKVKDKLEELGYTNFHSEENINGYVVDEVDYDKKLIIEVNGDYWHANPIKYKSDQVIKYPGGNKIAKEIWDKDKTRMNELKNLGYRIIVLWENDIQNKKFNITEWL